MILLKGGRLARTELVEWRGRAAVRKTLRMRPRIPLLSRELDRYLALRELRQLRRAEGIEGIPRVLARPAENVYLREFIEGTPLPRAPTPSHEFFDRLAEIARALHARGISHNDLHKEANVIVRPAGRPGLLDFQLSLSLPRGSWLHRLLAQFDLYHVAKNRRHRTGDPPAGEDAELMRRTEAIRSLHLFPGTLGKLPTDTDP